MVFSYRLNFSRRLIGVLVMVLLLLLENWDRLLC
jgi:hypothetical protein